MLTSTIRACLARGSLHAALLGVLVATCAGCGGTAPAPDPQVEVAAPAPKRTMGNPARPTNPKCSLAVLVVFDQMRADYLERWRDLWGEGGFRRLQSEGAWFTHCHYPFACTETGPGHATLATGRSPSSHGIVGNVWYDRQARQAVYCVANVKPNQAVPEGAAGEGPSSPERLLGPTVADALREATGGKGRVVSLSLKDRSAIPLAGRRPDACYWFDLWTGAFMTSSYYHARAHAWVTQFDRGRPADRWFGKDWTRLRPDLDYALHSGPELAPGGGTGWLQKRTFPHPTTGALKALDVKPYSNRDYYGAVFTSPFGNQLLLELARKAVDAEGLGGGPSQDLLCVSFSSLDAIGHSWGPDSQEVLDAMLRADRVVAELLAHLDAKVGRDNYVVVLTSDHGVCPLPEVSSGRKLDAGRVSLKRLTAEANAILDRAYGAGKDPWIEANVETWFYLNRKRIAERGLKASAVETTLARGLKDFPGVLATYTRTQLAQGGREGDALGEAVRRSFHADRSGDVTAVLKPYYVPGEDLNGTGHGSPHAYDTHVPLLVYGASVRPGRRAEAVTPQQVAGILAAALGCTPPAGADAPVAGIFKQ